MQTEVSPTSYAEVQSNNVLHILFSIEDTPLLISTSQLFIEPDFPEARKLKEWSEDTSSIPISREVISMGQNLDGRSSMHVQLQETKPRVMLSKVK